jgi:hypothetical protein
MNETLEFRLSNIVRTLEQAIYESEMAVNDAEKGYPYAAGYSRSAMKMVLDDIQDLRQYIGGDDNV